MVKDYFVIINLPAGAEPYEILGRNLPEYIDEALEVAPPKEIFLVQNPNLLEGIVNVHGRDSLYIVIPGNALIRPSDVLSALKMAEEEGTKNVINITEAPDFDKSLIIKNPVDLAAVTKVVQRRVNEKLMRSGVFIIDPDTAYIGPQVKIGPGTTINPGTIIMGNTTIGKNCEIGPNSRLVNMALGSAVKFEYSVASDSSIDDNTTVGPFAYLRPGSVIGKKVKIGDFVEIKNTTMGDGSKVSHLSYIGDADVGAGVNIGCGSITVNYDGQKKYRTTIEDGAFVGCNTNLIAPVTVGRNAYTAAGSTINKDVPEDALGIAREQQKNIEGWVKRKRGGK